MANPTKTVDAAIEAAAVASFGKVRVSIIRQTVSGGQLDAGVWFTLTIDRGDGWEVIGRRRTKQELWRMLKTSGMDDTCIVGNYRVESKHGEETN